MIGEALIRVEAPYFVAGVVIEDGSVRRAAPILRYMLGWSKGCVIAYAQRKNWRTTLHFGGTG